MRNNNNSDSILIYDRYFSKKPKAWLLALKRIILCVGIVVCGVMTLLSEYRLPIESGKVISQAIIFSAGFSLVFLFTKKRVSIPVIITAAAAVIYLQRETVAERLSYFADALWLLADGRFISGVSLISNHIWDLTGTNPEYLMGVELGFSLLIAVFSLVTAACCFKKTFILPSLLLWVLLWTPALVSEKFMFNAFLIPTAALYAAAFAINITHAQGLILTKDRGTGKNRERDYLRIANGAPFLKRTGMVSVYYSKYFASAVWVGAVFACLGIISSNILEGSKGVDYTQVYNFFKNLGSTGIKTPFDKSPVAEYFSGTDRSNKSDTLSVISPGNGEEEMLRVINTGMYPVYLRGDIGIDFLGTNWSTPIYSEPKLWTDSALKKYFRPVEMQINRELKMPMDPEFIAWTDVTVDYLADSNVVFLPAYTVDFGYYENDMFDVYGDFVVRVDDSYDKMNTVHCTALVPAFNFTLTNTYMTGHEDDVARDVCKTIEYHDLSAIADNYFNGTLSYDDYINYVYETYLSVPDNMKSMLDEFLETSGLSNSAAHLKIEDYDGGRPYGQYLVAKDIAEYLNSNYTYSLSDENDKRKPVEDFLNHTKKGHCALYASAMTLLMREMGIPARYCTGFVAQPNDGLPVVLKAKNLHAWCEVYLDEIGWVTFDPTSSATNLQDMFDSNSKADSDSSSDMNSSDRSESSDDSSESSASSDESDDDSDDRDNTHDGNDSSLTPSDKEKINILPYLITGISVLAVAALIIFVVRRVMRFNENADRQARRYAKSGNASEILEKMVAVLKTAGFSPANGELPPKFYERVDEALGSDLGKYTNELEAAAFGDSALSPEDCRKIGALFGRVYELCLKYVKFPKTLVLKFTVLKK